MNIVVTTTIFFVWTFFACDARVFHKDPPGQHQVSRDCYKDWKDCTGCRGNSDSCCSDKNCKGGRVCKRGMWSYSCDSAKRDTPANSEDASLVKENDYQDPPGQHQVSRDCYKDWKDCTGCRGSSDSCCSDKNCNGGRVCKNGIWSYYCGSAKKDSAVNLDIEAARQADEGNNAGLTAQ